MSKYLDLVKEIKNNPDDLSEFKFHIYWNRNGGARIYRHYTPTKISAGGYGYDRGSTVLSTLINGVIGEQDYKYAYTDGGSGKRTIADGIGIEEVINTFEKLDGCSLDVLYGAKDFTVYKIKFNKELIEKEK